MTQDRQTQDGTAAGQRWPFSRIHLLAGAAAVVGLGLLLLGAAYVGPVGRSHPALDEARPGLQIAHRDRKPILFTAGDKMDVLGTVENGFQGVPATYRDDAAEVQLIEADAPVEPAIIDTPRPVRFERPAEPVRVRRYTSDGGEDCTHAASRAEAMVCRDDRLGAADRAMRKALQRTLDDGVDPRRVMRDQADWEAARERAAVDGPGAVDRLYRIRLDELGGAY